MGNYKFNGDLQVTGNVYKDGVLDVPCEETTYAALKAKRDAGELVPGRWYRITDFVTTVANDTEARSAGHSFDVLVMATTNKTLSEDAKAAVNANDLSYFGKAMQVVVSATLKPGITIEDVDPQYKVTDGGGYDIPQSREREFTSIGTIENEDGVTVPYLFEPDPDDDGNDCRYVYVGTYEFDGVTYDMWQEHDSDGDPQPYYELTNVIVDSVLIKTAIEKYKLSAWSLKYCLDNDTKRFYWADREVGKGVIYRMIDEHGNDLPYDFKNIQFKRYNIIDNPADAVVSFTGYVGVKNFDNNIKYPTGCTMSDDDYAWLYTFAADNGDYDASLLSRYYVANNYISPYYWGNNLENPSHLNNVVFKGAASDNSFSSAVSSTITNGTSGNIVTAIFSNNVLITFSDNQISCSEFTANKGNNVSQNIIKGNMSDCEVYNFSYNLVASYFGGNKVVSYCQCNEFISSISANTFTQEFSGNKICGNGSFSNNSFNSIANRNVFMCTQFSSNTFNGTFSDNNIGCQYFKSNSFSTTAQFNKIRATNCNNNVVSGQFLRNDIVCNFFNSNGFGFAKIEDNLIRVASFSSNITTSGTSSSAEFSNNVFIANDVSVQQNSFCHFKNNRVYNSFNYNTFGVSGGTFGNSNGNVFEKCSSINFTRPVMNSEFHYVSNFNLEAAAGYCNFNNCDWVQVVHSGGTLKYVITTGKIAGTSESDMVRLTPIPSVDYVQEFTHTGKIVTEI